MSNPAMFPMLLSLVERCERCGEDIKRKHHAIWLELDQKEAVWRLPFIVPERRSQGMFAFHPSCAEEQLVEGARARREGGAK